MLIAAGADVNAIDSVDGTFPLLMASQEGHGAVASVLIVAGANLNQRFEPLKKTPLELCILKLGVLGVDRDARTKVWQCTLVLIGLGARLADGSIPDFPTQPPEEPYQSEKARAQQEMKLAIATGDASKVSQLLGDHGSVIDVNDDLDDEGTFSLMLAAGQGMIEIVDLLILQGAELQKVWRSQSVNSLELCLGMLAASIQEGDKSVGIAAWEGARALLAHGATDQAGNTLELPPRPTVW
ncbi:MAG: hypothetical protein AAFY82_10975, partial [Pseudomonadota bacterium]